MIPAGTWRGWCADTGAKCDANYDKDCKQHKGPQGPFYRNEGEDMIDTNELIDLALDLVAQDDTTGLCKNCGAEQDGVEPDAEKYICESCNAPAVYGAEQILVLFS
jgi:hypothetical protein